MTRIAIFVGNPKQESFCAALARAYALGARDADHDANLFELARRAVALAFCARPE